MNTKLEQKKKELIELEKEIRNKQKQRKTYRARNWNYLIISLTITKIYMEQVIYEIEKLIHKYTYRMNDVRNKMNLDLDSEIDYRKMFYIFEWKVQVLKELLQNINEEREYIRTLEKLEKLYNNDIQDINISNIKPMLSLNECGSEDDNF